MFKDRKLKIENSLCIHVFSSEKRDVRTISVISRRRYWHQGLLGIIFRSNEYFPVFLQYIRTTFEIQIENLPLFLLDS